MDKLNEFENSRLKEAMDLNPEHSAKELANAKSSITEIRKHVARGLEICLEESVKSS